ncbi:MAG: leucine--tRNA ligase [Patescibacteria group bacterium]|jgi:leucyl-tRNA synthetase
MSFSPYDHQVIEKKWQAAWLTAKVFAAHDASKVEKHYVLDMFPYPSAQGLHVGHPEGYTASDILSRYLRMQGMDVLHPMGFDSFGLPAENYAIKTGTHPAKTTAENIANMRRQIQSLGFSYDWDREVITSDPSYYKWTQWIFLKLFEKGLAYEAEAPINWCPKDKTGLANEEVVGGKCDRCGTPVEKKRIRQWLVKITDERYIERLLNDLDHLDWPESIKQLQRNWIGKSEGAEVRFAVEMQNVESRTEKGEGKTKNVELQIPKVITVFTTRPDTLFGATYVVLAPEHVLVKEITTDKHRIEIEQYVAKAQQKTDLDRTDLSKEKTGVFTGAYAINPVNQEKIPVWVADYVLATYGTGAIMAVPAHDERDFGFAEKYQLPKIQVIEPTTAQDCWYFKYHNPKYLPNEQSALLEQRIRGEIYFDNESKDAVPKYFSFTGEGTMLREATPQTPVPTNPLEAVVSPGANGHFGNDLQRVGYDGPYEGLTSQEFRKVITGWLVKTGIGKAKVQYKLRDWVFSRQRYWGEPIPMVHCAKCGIVPVPEKQLPVLLPDVKKYEPTGTGESPLAGITDWVNTKCPNCGGAAKRETNTMPQWAGSNWYFLRYCDPKNDKVFADPEKLKAWLPVDVYVGGAEHAVLHLLYARFIYKVLFDISAIPKECGDEPFVKLKNQGLILGEDGVKMSKSRGNVINPDDVIKEYGADAVRMYEMFMGPFEDAKPWSTQGIRGITRFLEKVWALHQHVSQTASHSLLPTTHGFLDSFSRGIERFAFNTCVSDAMKWVNAMTALQEVPRQDFVAFLKVLSTFAPHIAEELWHELGHETFICQETWPKFDPALAVQDTFTLPVQINSKVRVKLDVATQATEVEVRTLVLANETVQKWLAGKEPKQFRYVAGKIVSIVV